MPGDPWFDEACYRTQLGDTANPENAWLHFARIGFRQHRLPTEALLLLANQCLGEFPDQPVDAAPMLSSAPVHCRQGFAQGQFFHELRSFFMPALYRAQLGERREISEESLFAHYLYFGWQLGCRPSVLFNEAHYRDMVACALDASIRQPHQTMIEGLRIIDGILHLVDPNRPGPGLTLEEARATFPDAPLVPVGHCNPYLHWYFHGRLHNVIPTPLFDTEYYLTRNTDLNKGWKSAPFEHYLHHGVKELWRDSSYYFESRFYRRQRDELTYDSPMLDYVLEGQALGLSTAPGFNARTTDVADELRSSRAEEAARSVLRRLRQLDTGVLADMIARVRALEPQIDRPYEMRRVSMAPTLHAEVDLMLEARSIVAALPQKHYDTVVLIPHARMAGSAKIAGKFTRILNELSGSGDVLVVLTDLSVFERPDWYPDNVDVFDFSTHVDGAPRDRKVRALLDLVRGVRAKRLININSNIGWRLTSHYCRQLSEWMELYVYLFCWDLDIYGNRGGYPIQWFLPTFDHCTAVFTDSNDLRDELRQRYCLTDAQRNRIVTLHTPAEDRHIDYNPQLQQRVAHEGTRRVFWSGRFDRQKRVDLLFAIASRLPNIEFWVWGKAVLNDDSIDLDSAPGNIRFMGAYQRIDDVPIASCDLFLYTSGWDGLPTVLIEVGSRAVPVVASDVGGVGDLIREDTGWPIADANNPDAYVAAIQDILSDYDAALQRSAALRTHTLSLCNEDSYARSVATAMVLGTQSAEEFDDAA